MMPQPSVVIGFKFDPASLWIGFQRFPICGLEMLQFCLVPTMVLILFIPRPPCGECQADGTEKCCS